MNATYIASDNSTGDAQVLGAAGQDVFIKKIFFGAPADGDITLIHDKRVAPGHASGIGSVNEDDVVLKYTQPTAAAGKPYGQVLDFGEPGLQVDGGSVHTDASQVTIMWDEV